MTRETELLATWLDNVEEADLREELEAMRDDEKAAIEAFHKDLEFGTAGLRGIIGAGTDRMNVYTVGRATQGFADYLVANYENPSVVIGRDSRNKGDEFVRRAAEDAFERLIFPSVQRETRNDLTDMAAAGAIHNFALNLKPLLMQPPVKGFVTMGLDPGYKNGCKVAIVDSTGRVLDTTVVYPTFGERKKQEAIDVLSRMALKHGVKHIAIGNGTASRETEAMTVEMLKKLPGVSYMIVNEAGASVYSASKLAAEEFPDYDVNLRSAVSIARRMQDPLAELVKIDPKAIGVGQYQHDMPAKRLDEALGGVVEDCVNAVGVDVNTASASLLQQVSGLNGTTAKNVVLYREENGAFTSRSQLKKVPKLGPKAYQQCAGFLRVPESKEILDNTGVHPETYTAAEKLLELAKQLIVLGGAEEPDGQDSFSPMARKVLLQSEQEANAYGERLAGTEHMLVALLKERMCLAVRLLNTLEVNVQKVFTDAVLLMGGDMAAAKAEFAISRGKGTKRSSTPTLEQYSRDLTLQAEEHIPFFYFSGIQTKAFDFNVSRAWKNC